MNHAKVALLVVLSLPTAAWADELEDGLLMAYTYKCNAEEMAQDFVQSCASKFPALSGEASQALAKWRATNLVPGQKQKKACAVRSLEDNKGMPAADIETVRLKMLEIKANIKLVNRANISHAEKSDCAEMMIELGNTTQEFDKDLE